MTCHHTPPKNPPRWCDTFRNAPPTSVRSSLSASSIRYARLSITYANTNIYSARKNASHSKPTLRLHPQIHTHYTRTTTYCAMLLSSITQMPFKNGFTACDNSTRTGVWHTLRILSTRSRPSSTPSSLLMSPIVIHLNKRLLNGMLNTRTPHSPCTCMQILRTNPHPLVSALYTIWVYFFFCVNANPRESHSFWRSLNASFHAQNARTTHVTTRHGARGHLHLACESTVHILYFINAQQIPAHIARCNTEHNTPSPFFLHIHARR